MNDHSTLAALGSAIFTVTVFGGTTLLLYVGGTVFGETYLRASRHESNNPQPFTLALLGALGEVLIARPLRLHRSRMAVVRRMEEERADAISAAALRHPANHRARMAAMAAHPANSGHRAEQATEAPLAVGGASLHAVGNGRRLHSVTTWDGGDAA